MTDYIDTHQHLIYHDLFGYDWAAGIDALSKSNFTAQDYLALTADKPVKGSIFWKSPSTTAIIKQKLNLSAHWSDTMEF